MSDKNKQSVRTEKSGHEGREREKSAEREKNSELSVNSSRESSRHDQVRRSQHRSGTSRPALTGGSRDSHGRIPHGSSLGVDEHLQPAPERPPPPLHGRVTHHSIELNWEDAIKRAMTNYTRADGRIKVTLQEEDRHANWVNIYSGYAKRHIVDNLEPWTQYRYRLRFSNNQGNSEWSHPYPVFTLKEPMNGEHLHKAVLMQNLEQLEAVVESGDISTVDTLDRLGFTPLMQAAQKGYHEIIDALAKYGAEIDFQNDSGKTALMLACFAGKLKCVKELRHYGASYKVQDRGGSTPFHWAMDSKNTDLIDWMIDDGVEKEATDFNGWTPILRVAAVGGSPEVTKLLLRRGVQVNIKDKDGKTPLMMAVINGHTSMVEQLLKKGADVQIKNEFGKSAYEMAVSMERRMLLKIFEAHFEEHNIKYY